MLAKKIISVQGSMVTVNSKFLKEHHPEAKLKDLVKLALAAKEIDKVIKAPIDFSA